MNKMKSKKALSGVLTVVILIALVVVAAGLIWGVILPMINSELEGAQSCADAFDKITINKVYTCYDSVDNTEAGYTGETQISIKLDDIELDKIIVSVLYQGNSKSFELIQDQEYVFLREATSGSSFSTPINLLGRNSGKSYIIDTRSAFFGFGSTSGSPESITIAPVVDGERCQTVDSAVEIEQCGQDIFVG